MKLLNTRGFATREPGNSDGRGRTGRTLVRERYPDEASLRGRLSRALFHRRPAFFLAVEHAAGQLIDVALQRARPQRQRGDNRTRQYDKRGETEGPHPFAEIDN